MVLRGNPKLRLRAPPRLIAWPESRSDAFLLGLPLVHPTGSLSTVTAVGRESPVEPPQSLQPILLERIAFTTGDLRPTARRLFCQNPQPHPSIFMLTTI